MLLQLIMNAKPSDRQTPNRLLTIDMPIVEHRKMYIPYSWLSLRLCGSVLLLNPVAPILLTP
jgi:hypothetical protein